MITIQIMLFGAVAVMLVWAIAIAVAGWQDKYEAKKFNRVN